MREQVYSHILSSVPRGCARRLRCVLLPVRAHKCCWHAGRVDTSNLRRVAWHDMVRHSYSFTDLMLDVREWDDRAERVGRNEFVAVTKLVSPAPVSATLLRRCATTRTSVLRRTVLCQTLAGNPVPLLTITNFASPQADIDARPYIVLSGRVHPGETNASWMMRGVLDFLTSSAREADLLRDLAIFKVVPFLNPDGVINGHHRTWPACVYVCAVVVSVDLVCGKSKSAGCNLSGEDLNRHWTAPVKGGTPTVFYTKKLLALCKRRRVSVFCDFHGHSRKKNIFMFGCENSDGTPERVFPRLLDRCAPDFSYKCVCGGGALAKLPAVVSSHCSACGSPQEL